MQITSAFMKLLGIGTQMVDWQRDMAKKIDKIFTYSKERAKKFT